MTCFFAYIHILQSGGEAMFCIDTNQMIPRKQEDPFLS